MSGQSGVLAHACGFVTVFSWRPSGACGATRCYQEPRGEGANERERGLGIKEGRATKRLRYGEKEGAGSTGWGHWFESSTAPLRRTGLRR